MYLIERVSSLGGSNALVLSYEIESWVNSQVRGCVTLVTKLAACEGRASNWRLSRLSTCQACYDTVIVNVQLL